MQKRTTCDECQRVLVLDEEGDGILLGNECECGYYVTRYMPGMSPR